MASRTRDRQRGQMLVLFTLALVAIIAMVGLVIDGGAAYGQRRGQQNAADLAALAGADAQMNGLDAANAAFAVAELNGYKNGTNRVEVTVTPDASEGTVKVDISAPHQNYFAGVVGQSEWMVGVTATALGSVTPDTATGALPLLMPSSDFECDDATPKTCAIVDTFGKPDDPFTWTHGKSLEGDAPADEFHVAWTLFDISAAGGNLDDARLTNLIDGELVVTMTALVNDYLGQHNDGEKADAFGQIADLLPEDGTGRLFAVPVVGPPTSGTTCRDETHSDGCFLGWAVLRIMSASQGGKSITGYFTSAFLPALSNSGVCSATTCPQNLGGYTPLALTN